MVGEGSSGDRGKNSGKNLICKHLLNMVNLCLRIIIKLGACSSGDRALASGARSAGSIPARRTKFLVTPLLKRGYLFVLVGFKMI